MPDDPLPMPVRARLARMWLMAALVAGCAGTPLGAGAGPQPRERRPTYLPDGFAPQPAERCALGDAGDVAGTMLVYHDDGRRESPIGLPRTEPGALYVGSWDTTRPLPGTGRPLTLDDLVAGAAPGSAYTTMIQGRPARGYTVASPSRSSPHLVLAWQVGTEVVWVFGEEITALEMVEVAESVLDVSDGARAEAACSASPDQIQAATSAATATRTPSGGRGTALTNTTTATTRG